MASSILLKFPRNTEVQTKDINVEDALSRVRRPLDSTKLTLCVNGVFALPESWKAKIQTVSFSLPLPRQWSFILLQPLLNFTR